ncbi:MAG: FFLEELY motif protein [Vicinamibacteria bacterium]
MAAAPPSPAVVAQVRELERARAMHAARAQNPILAGALERLSDWQSRRLAATYADLAREGRYAQAIAFFQSDLYGPQDFSRRDADLARVVPMMARMLPESVILTVAKAMELSALSHELDMRVNDFLPRADAQFTVEDYCRAFRRAGRLPERQRQIELIGEVGMALDRAVGKPLIRAALALMRAPARAAGLAERQTFHERGFEAFRRMKGAETFLATIRDRETAIVAAIFDGRIAPFAEPPLKRRTTSG